MFLTCLDLEGVLIPEIWIEFANKTGIEEFRRTTRDEPDYKKLMDMRMSLMHKHGLGLLDIQEVAASIEPFDGACEFLDELKRLTQVVLVSDAMYQMVEPILPKLGYPTIFCNSFEVNAHGDIIGVNLPSHNSKKEKVQAFQSMGFETIAAGDSHNDIEMIQVSKAGALFKTTRQLKEAHPDLLVLNEYDQLLNLVKETISSEAQYD